MNVPLSQLICGLQVYCLSEIINLLMGASLLALAKSICYSQGNKTHFGKKGFPRDFIFRVKVHSRSPE